MAASAGQHHGGIADGRRANLDDPVEVALDHQGGDPFERVDAALGGLTGGDDGRSGSRLLEERVRRLKLAAEPFRDSGRAMVRLVAELAGQLPLGLAAEELDVLGTVEDLGVGERHQCGRAHPRPTSGSPSLPA